MINDLISGIEKVQEALQWEPSFHDGEIITIVLHRDLDRPLDGAGPSLDISIWAPHYAEGRQSLRTIQEYLITLRFEGIENLKIEEFNHQNVIQTLVVDQAESRLKVGFFSLFGAEVSFTCARARVAGIVPVRRMSGRPLA